MPQDIANVDWLKDGTLVLLADGRLALSPNKPYRHNAYSFRIHESYGATLRASDQVTVLRYPASIAFDELLRHQDRIVNDGSHI